MDVVWLGGTRWKEHAEWQKHVNKIKEQWDIIGLTCFEANDLHAQLPRHPTNPDRIMGVLETEELINIKIHQFVKVRLHYWRQHWRTPSSISKKTS